MVMPEMDGIELAREIRRTARTYLPLLLVRRSAGCRRLARPTRFAAQLAKPIKASQLHDA